MKNSLQSWWHRLIKQALPAESPVQTPIKETANEHTLARLDENDPVLKCLLDHAFAQFANDLAVALDRSLPAETRLRAADGAVAIRAFIEDVEQKRVAWTTERRRRELEEKRGAE